MEIYLIEIYVRNYNYQMWPFISTTVITKPANVGPTTDLLFNIHIQETNISYEPCMHDFSLLVHFYNNQQYEL